MQIPDNVKTVADARSSVDWAELGFLLNTLKDGITVIDTEMRLAAFNKSFQQLYGFAPGEIQIGEHLSSIYGKIYDKGNLNQDYGGRDATIQARLANWRNLDSWKEERRELATGSIIDIYRSEFANGDSLSIHVDVTATHESQIELDRQQHNLSMILEHISDGVTLIDREGRFAAFNQKFLENYSVDPEKVHWGMHYDELALNFGDLRDVSSERREVEIARRRAFALDKSRARIKRRLLDGRTLDVFKTPLPNGDSVLTIRDETENLRREHELTNARARAEESNRQKSEFLARMSHEMRTPLNGILGMTALVRNTELDARQQEYMSVISSSGEMLLRLIDDVLDLARIEARTFELVLEPFDLATMLAECMAMTEPSATSKSLKTVLVLPDQTIPTALGDPVRLKQVVLNLLSNAVKFTEEGTVTLELYCKTSDDVLNVEISVTDSGIGIEEEMLEMIFQQFFQANGSVTREHGGAGLGLAIAQRLIDAMDGSISVASEAGAGARFSVLLPLPLVKD